ncbi:MAG TPA: branched-chain amino acid ABC transporter permease [Acidimicrobiales bacterium]|nr:branched-chain amino acid ABC transporter permease [Acidimicrobiales bacterium]
MTLFIASTGFGIVVASILMIASVGFTLQWGVSNVLNLAYVDFMILTPYLDYSLNQQLHLDKWLSIVLSVAGVALASVAFNQYLLQPFVKRGIRFFYLLIIAFAAGTILEYVILAIWGPTFFNISVGGNNTYSLAGLKLSEAQLIIIAIAVASMIGIHLLLTRTDFGRSMRAVAINPMLAQCSGIRTSAVLNATWFLTGTMCGIAGLVLAFNTATFDVNTGAAFLAELLAAVVLGGIGSPYGAMVGAIIIGVVAEWAALLIDPFFNVVVALVALVVTLLFRPEGLVRSLTSSTGGGTA